VYEEKYDGRRIVAYNDGNDVRLALAERRPASAFGIGRYADDCVEACVR
jgi:hypothetical protein